MEKLWGRIAAVPADRVKTLEDGEVIQLSPFEIRAIATPGHASHHHVYHWDDSVFGGDIAGVRIGLGPPIPPFVPPELHIEQWHDSIAKIRALNARHLYLPHFGKIEGEVSDHLAALDERVDRWSEWLRDKIQASMKEDELRSAFATYEHDDLGMGSSANRSRTAACASTRRPRCPQVDAITRNGQKSPGTSTRFAHSRACSYSPLWK